MSKTITRKYIQRITKREGNTNIRQSSGGGGGGGGASQYWVEENYISKLFFNQLFTVYDEDGNIVEPNDTESVIASIKSMFGFWTDAYLSALGNGEGGGAELTLASLADVDVHGVANGQALVYDATTQKWVPGQGGGIDITAMWAALAQSGVQQIDASHLATALTGYATETWVGNQGYITGSALNGYATESWVGSQISDMATQTWVSGNYLSQTNAAATYLTQTNAAATYLTKTDAATTYVSIAFFERLFKAYNGSTVVHPNNTTSTIDNIKAMFGFWTDFYLSALGNGSGGSSGGVTMAQVWSALGNATTEQINATHLTNALSGYNPTDNFKTINGNSIIGTGDIVVSGGGGDYLPLTGGTLSRATTTNADSILKVINTATHIYPRGVEIFTPNNSAMSTPLLMGKAYGTNNMCDIDFIYTDSGSTENAMSFGFYDNDHLIYLKANGNVGIGTTSPTQKLEVNGNVLASSFIKSGGTSLQFLKADGSVDSNTYATTSSLGNYLPLTGGTMSGTISFTTYPCVRYIDGTTAKMNLGYYPTGGYSYFSNETNKWELRIYDNGDLNYSKWNIGTTYNIWHSGNFSPGDYVTLGTAQTITGVKTFSPTISSSNNSVIYLNNTYNGSYARCIDITFVNQPASGFNTPFLFGKSDAKNNKGTIDFGYVGNQSNSNYVGIGFYANDNIFVVTGGGNVGIGTTSPSYKLHVAGTFYASGNSSIGGTLGVTGATTLSSTLSVTSNTTVGGTLGVTGATTLSSTLGVTGATTLSSTLVVSGNAKFSGYTGFGYDADTNYRVKVKGVAYASTGVYSGGYVTALSDIRHKDVKGNVGLTVSEIANAPSVKFLWKDRRQDGMQVGSIAQYWKKVMPEAIVENADGELTMSYGVIALLASIATARKVEDHERRIAELERENKLLKEQLNVA